MSDNIIPFHNGNEDYSDNCCPQCDLAHEYLHYVLETIENGTVDDLFGILRGLVEEAGKLSLIDFLEQELEHNAKLLDLLVYGEYTDSEK